MRDFCKLYQDDEFGQILVMIDDFDAAGPEIRVSFAMSGYGICSEVFKFTDDDEGWDKAEAGFDAFTFEDAWSVCNNIDKQLRVLGI